MSAFVSLWQAKSTSLDATKVQRHKVQLFRLFPNPQLPLCFGSRGVHTSAVFPSRSGLPQIYQHMAERDKLWRLCTILFLINLILFPNPIRSLLLFWTKDEVQSSFHFYILNIIPDLFSSAFLINAEIHILFVRNSLLFFECIFYWWFLIC